MTDLITKTRREFDQECPERPKVSENKCNVSLKGVSPQHVVVSFVKRKRRARATGNKKGMKICDFLVVAKHDKNGHWIVPIEVKRGAVNSARRVAEQIQGGTDLVKSLLSDSDRYELLPIVASLSISKDARRELRLPANKIRLGNGAREVIRIKCGQRLSSQMR